MPVDQLSPRRAPRPASDTKLVQYDQYIDTQIQNTRRAVKAVDWATSLVELVIGVLLFLLAAAVIDHWIIPGGFSVAMRMVLFAVLVSGIGYFSYRRLWPLCRRAINPVYAAQTIEQASPSLKNSLINLLLFRQHRGEIPEAVYQTLEEQAARRLTRVSVDSAVDRTALVRIGCVLLAVVSLAALYTLISPKNPLIAAQRVLLPWADIVPASRVLINSVTPGSATVARGEFVDVSAEIRGIDENDAVLLRYTTDDGQAIDKPIEMKQSEDGLRFVARLPDAASGAGQVGLAQNVRYRIEAGDARTLDYQVIVVPAPSILVERIGYDYPDYTGFVDRDADGSGDIRAIEGTRVTIHARANGAIQESHIDFDADGRSDVKMAGQDAGAQGSFVLELREDRQTPRHASYVLRFTNTEGRTNRDPVKYPITVEPDRFPEAAVLRPQEKTLDVRLNDTLTIEAEARDPDFGLSEVRLHGEVAGRQVIDEPLLTGEHTGRFTGRYQFTPSAHDLRPGDVVDYWVVARDIKTPAPNTIESERKRLRISSPDPAQEPPPDRIAQADRQRRPNNQQRNQQQAERRDQQQPQNRGQQNRGEHPGEQSSGDAPQDGEPASAGGKQQPGEGQQQPQPNSDQNQPQNGEPASAGGEQNPGQSGESSNNKQTGAGAAGGEASQQGSQPDGTRPDSNSTTSPSKARPDSGSGQQQPNAEKAPVSSEGDNDAEAFQRIQQHLERKGDLKDDEPETPQPDEQFSRDAQRSAEEERQADKETRTQGDKENPATNKGDGQPTSVGGQKPNERTEGIGADTKQDDLPDQTAQPRDSREQTNSPGGQQTSSKGPSGAGDQQQNQGAPNAQPEMKPGQKREQSGSEDAQTDQQETPAGARGKESDSQGEQGGDKAGGGEEGGGQKTPREGTGSAGQNQSADEGAGESTEKGSGNNSPNAGQDAASNQRTGQPGKETPGPGSSQRDGEGTQPGGAERNQTDKQTGGQGDQPPNGEPASAGGEQKPNEGQQPAQNNPSNGNAPPSTDQDNSRNGEPASAGGEKQPSAGQPQPQNQSSQPEAQPGEQVPQRDPDQRGTPTGEGGETGTAGSASPSEGIVPEGDPANLEYTRKQTELVLDKLADQLKKKQVDKNLLEQLGWTEDELQRFVARWQERKAAAQRNDAAGQQARRELDDALRSLGLRRGPLKQGPIRDDTQRDLRQGFRGPVPLEYRERLRSYNQGVSRARRESE
jgi:hypothetical protein